MMSSFIQSLRRAMETSSAPIEWCSVGIYTNALRVCRPFNPSECLTCTTSQHYESFLRQLRNYGFVSVGPKAWHHVLFQRDRPDLDKYIMCHRHRHRR